MKRNRGFTLIELMITLAVFSLMVTMGAQLTRSWVDSARQRDVAGLLKQGISRAKATALRNPGGALNSWPAAALCRSGQVLKLYSVTDQASINCASTSNILWQASLPGAATIQAGGTDISCVAFNSRGLPVNGSASCTTSTISVTVGNESAVDVEII
ncbi:prepilin-type N-terminal cleavage/methylation domain-containing protein [Pseudomonas syringae]|nr:prepilin-type N-terminal cleavage/methylation domain-containing protein [Pseudomonas syringae]